MHESRFLVEKACRAAQFWRSQISERRKVLRPHLEYLYAKAPERIRARMQEDGRDPLMDIFEYGRGYVRIDFGPHQSFASKEEVLAACHELAVLWTDEILVETDSRYYSAVHVTFTPSSLPRFFTKDKQNN